MEKWLIFLGIMGLVFFLIRRGGMGCCGGSHSHEAPPEHAREKSEEHLGQ